MIPWYSKLLTILAWLTALPLVGQGVLVTILDETSSPIPAVMIIDTEDSTFYLTDETGIAQLSIGNFLIHQLGYRDYPFSVSSNDPLTIRLTPDPITLGMVTVNGLSERTVLLDQPRAISVLPLQKIATYNLPQYATMMNSVPGVFMNSGSINTNKITIRGIGSRSQYDTEKVRAYLGNIPLTNGSGQSTIEDQDLGFLGKIEVLKGPSGSQYGNGLGGTILLEPRLLFGKNESIRFAQIGSYGTRIFGLLSGFQLNPKHHLTLGTQKSHSNGYRDNNELNRRSFFVAHEYQNNHIKLQILTYHIDQKAYIPSSISKSDVASDPKQAAFTWASARGYEDYGKNMIGTSINFAITKQWTLVSSIFGNHFRSYEPRPFNILQEVTLGFGSRNRLIYESPTLTWIFGQEYFKDFHQFQTYQNLYQQNSIYGSLQGSELSNFHEKRSYHNLFSQFTYRAGSKLFIQGGLNLNTTGYQLEDRYPDALDQSGSYRFKPTLSPSLSLSYQTFTNGKGYISINHGFSPPTLEQTLTPEGVINPDIKPETGYQLEVGHKSLGEKGYFSIAAYRMWVNNLLVSRRTAEDQYIGINAGSTSHMGVEIEANYRWIERSNLSLTQTASGSIGRFQFKDFREEDAVYDRNLLPGIPESTAYSDLTFESKGFKLTIMYQRIGSMYLDDSNTVKENAYNLVHTRATQRLVWRGITLEGGFTFNNLLDTKYNSMVLVNAVGFGGSEPRYYYPGLPRNLLLHGSISWN